MADESDEVRSDGSGDREVYIAPGLRSPFARIDRELSDLDGLQISVPVVQQTVAGPNGPGPERSAVVDLVLWGAVIPSLRVSNWGREVWLEAGLDGSVPAQGIAQACGTSLAAATHAAGQIRSGTIDLALGGGVESMSYTEIGLSQGLSRTIRRLGRGGGLAAMARTLGELRAADLSARIPSADERVTGMSMGEHGEQMAKEWEIPRDAQDRLALASHRKAVTATENGFFRSLLVSPGTFPIDVDGIPRSDTSLDKLAKLSPAFDPEDGTLTAGNSTALTDGAAAVWIGSSRGLDRLRGDLPRARLVDWEQAAVDPRREGLLMAPALAIPRLLARHGLRYEDVGLWEVHEAFAAQVLCTVRALESPEWLREKAGVELRSEAEVATATGTGSGRGGARRDDGFGDFPRDRMNPHGGSVALGHPFAATGARILSQTVAELADREPGTRAVVSICAAGGLGHVALLEAVQR